MLLKGAAITLCCTDLHKEKSGEAESGVLAVIFIGFMSKHSNL